MSDFDISGSDSEPVSDINPEEMDKLMADLGDFDDVFKSSDKSSAKTKPSAEKERTKDESRRVTFNAKKESEKDDEWDADDLLQSDDDIPKMKAQKSKSSDMHANLEKKTTPSDGKDKRNLAKSKLMADLFSGDSENKMEERSDSRPDQLSASSNVRSAKKDKSKLMAELFGNNPTATQESSQNPNSGGDKKSIGGSNTRQTTKKSKDEITFDDDDDDLFGGLGESEKKNTKSVSDSPKDSGFLDSLLAKSNASEKKQTDIKKTSEFILDEKYINMSKAKKEEQESFGGYKPSVGKLDSPRRRTPKKSPATDPFDILGDSQPRRPNLRSGTQRKTLELDDDILGTRRSNKGSNRQQEKEIETKSESDLNKGDAASSASQVKAGNRGKDDWLFNGLGSEASKAKKNTVTEPAEPKEDGTQKPSSSASKSPDWLGSLLSCDKKSSGGSNQVVSTSSMPDGISAPSVHHSPATPHFESKDIGGGHPSKDLNTTLPDAKSASSTTTLVLPASSGTNEQLQLLKEHQDAQLQNAAQMKAQQDLIEAQMALQVQQQQQQMANEIKQQQATMKRYQEAMLNMTQLTPTSVPLANKPDNDDELKDLKVSLRSAEIEVARLQAELDLIRKQHSKEISLLEDAQIRKMNVEKEVWEQTEKRLREERDSAVIELQSKLSALQSEKDNLVTSYDVQLGSVKSEWSHALERTKELYKGMMERMKDEHSEALQRITDLKELELKAAVSASGHVRDVEVVMNQLESNASNLSEITAIINSKQDSALEMTQRALKIKEKQLKDFEAQLSAAQAENGSERGRLNTLIHRLENTLIQQGSEVEKERWSMAQKVMKIEVERQAINEERRHMQHSVETERQNLARAREILMDEHRAMLQDISQKKQELESQRAQLSTQKKLNELHSTNVLANTSAWGLNEVTVDAEATFLSNEHRRLKEKFATIERREQEVKQNEDRLEEEALHLKQEKDKMELERTRILQEQNSAVRKNKKVEALQQELQVTKQAQQDRLLQIKSQTASLHANQKRMEKERQRLDLVKKEVMQSVQLGLCPACQSRRGTGLMLDLVNKYSANSRVPGDGGEGYENNRIEKHNSTNLAPASVLARLTAAREHENLERERRLQQIAAFESS